MGAYRDHPNVFESGICWIKINRKTITNDYHEMDDRIYFDISSPSYANLKGPNYFSTFL